MNKLKQDIRDAWDEINLDYTFKLHRRIPRHLRTVIDGKGKATKYHIAVEGKREIYYIEFRRYGSSNRTVF